MYEGPHYLARFVAGQEYWLAIDEQVPKTRCLARLATQMEEQPKGYLGH